MQKNKYKAKLIINFILMTNAYKILIYKLNKKSITIQKLKKLIYKYKTL